MQKIRIYDNLIKMMSAYADMWMREPTNVILEIPMERGNFILKKVLIVDDGAFMRLLIKGILGKNDYEVIGEAEDGFIAIDKFKELRPDLVTMDITMPNCDGIAALKEILKEDKDACVIMVSSMGQEAYIKEAISSGAKGFIVKPFDESTFMAILNSLETE